MKRTIPWRPWRDYWTRRVRLQWILALICLLGALLVGAAALAPSSWLTTADGWLISVWDALGAFATTVSSLDPHTLTIVVAAALVALALGLAFLPRRPRVYRRSGAFTGQAPSQNAMKAGRVLVYMDAENQPPSDFDTPQAEREAQETRALKLLMGKLREELAAMPNEPDAKSNKPRVRNADLFFYMDSTISQYRFRRQLLHRYGFRLVDVPHDPYQTRGEWIAKKGMVDVELALQLYGSSLVSLNPQDIILIASDQDYIPLVYHLWADGHHVQIWADVIGKAYLRLAQDLNAIRPGTIKVVAYDPQTNAQEAIVQITDQPGVSGLASSAPPQLALPTPTAPAHRELPRSWQQRSWQQRSWQQRPWQQRSGGWRQPAIRVTDRNGSELSRRIQEAVAQTLPDEDAVTAGIRLTLYLLAEAKRAGGSSERAQQLFTSGLSWLKPILSDRLGYRGARYVGYWLIHLQSAGALTFVAPATYTSGSASVEIAAERLKQFLQQVATLANTLKVTAQSDSLPLDRLCAAVRQAPPAPDLVAFVALLDPQVKQPGNTNYLNHMRFFCLCARALGYFDVDEQSLLNNPPILKWAHNEPPESQQSPATEPSPVQPTAPTESASEPATLPDIAPDDGVR